MNMILKSAVAGVLALGASGAYAVGVPSSNSSDLILVIASASGNYYAADTGVSMDTLMPAGSLAAGSVLSTALTQVSSTLAASATLQSFLAANPLAGDGWTLEGGAFLGDTSTGTAKVVGQARAAFTSLAGTTNNNTVNAKVLGNIVSYLTGLNNDFASGAAFSGLTTGSEVTGSGFTADTEGSKYAFFGAADLSSAGSAQQLFGFTGGGTPGKLSSYLLGSATLSANGSLSINPGSTSPVPLPAAVWLFGSGLVGLVGVSRRRKAASTAVAV